MHSSETAWKLLQNRKKGARIWFPIHFYCPIPSHLKVEYEKLVKQIFLAFQSPLYLSLSYFLFSNRNRVVRLSPRASVSVNTDSIKMVFPVQLWRMRKCSISSSTPTNDGFFLSDSIVLLLPFAPLSPDPPPPPSQYSLLTTLCVRTEGVICVTLVLEWKDG